MKKKWLYLSISPLQFLIDKLILKLEEKRMLKNIYIYPDIKYLFQNCKKCYGSSLIIFLFFRILQTYLAENH